MYKPLPVKGYKERKANKLKSAFSSSSSSVFSVTSDISCYNQGDARDRDEDNQEEEFDIIEDSLPIADSLEVCKRTLSIKPTFRLEFLKTSAG